MKTTYAKKFSRFLLVAAVAGATAFGTAPASLQSQDPPIVRCYPIDEQTESVACLFCKLMPLGAFCSLCALDDWQ